MESTSCFFIRGDIDIPPYFVRDEYDRIQNPWSEESELYLAPIPNNPTVSSLIHDSAVYLKCKLATHAVGTLTRALKLCSADSPDRSKIHGILGTCYLHMNLLRYAFQNIYKAVTTIEPEQDRLQLLTEIQPIWSSVFIEEVSPIKVDDTLYVNCSIKFITAMANLSRITNITSLPSNEIVSFIFFAYDLLLSNDERRKKNLSFFENVTPLGETVYCKRGEWKRRDYIAYCMKYATVVTRLPRRFRASITDDRTMNGFNRDIQRWKSFVKNIIQWENVINVFPSGPDEQRKLLSTGYQEPGKVYLNELHPFAGFCSDIDSEHGCAHCWRSWEKGILIQPGYTKPLKGSEPITCSNCRDKFCSERCLQLAQYEYHPVLCEHTREWKTFLRSLNLSQSKNAVPNQVCLAIKLTAMAVLHGVNPLCLPLIRHYHRKCDAKEPILNEEDRILASTPTSIVRNGEIVDITNRFTELCPNLTRLGVGMAGHVIELCDALTVNTFGSGQVGGLHHASAYVITALANHSCEPNTSYSCFYDQLGNQQVFNALTRLSPMEEITIDYGIASASYEERQRYLHEQYGFICKCAKCEREKPQSTR